MRGTVVLWHSRQLCLNSREKRSWCHLLEKGSWEVVINQLEASNGFALQGDVKHIACES